MRPADAINVLRRVARPSEDVYGLFDCPREELQSAIEVVLDIIGQGMQEPPSRQDAARRIPEMRWTDDALVMDYQGIESHELARFCHAAFLELLKRQTRAGQGASPTADLIRITSMALDRARVRLARDDEGGA